LSDATPQNSCLYCLPRAQDTGYHASGDAIRESIVSPLQWLDFVAQPIRAGGMLTFSHRLLHWASNPQPSVLMDSDEAKGPRIAITQAFADPAFEPPYFDHVKYSPFPPLGLRLGLVAGQLITYNHMSPLDAHGIGLFRRIFYAQKAFFEPIYAEKVTSKIQFLAFERQNQRFSQRRKN